MPCPARRVEWDLRDFEKKKKKKNEDKDMQPEHGISVSDPRLSKGRKDSGWHLHQ